MTMMKDQSEITKEVGFVFRGRRKKERTWIASNGYGILDFDNGSIEKMNRADFTIERLAQTPSSDAELSSNLESKSLNIADGDAPKFNKKNLRKSKKTRYTSAKNTLKIVYEGEKWNSVVKGYCTVKLSPISQLEGTDSQTLPTPPTPSSIGFTNTDPETPDTLVSNNNETSLSGNSGIEIGPLDVNEEEVDAPLLMNDHSETGFKQTQENCQHIPLGSHDEETHTSPLTNYTGKVGSEEQPQNNEDEDSNDTYSHFPDTLEAGTCIVDPPTINRLKMLNKDGEIDNHRHDPPGIPQQSSSLIRLKSIYGKKNREYFTLLPIIIFIFLPHIISSMFMFKTRVETKNKIIVPLVGINRGDINCYLFGHGDLSYEGGRDELVKECGHGNDYFFEHGYGYKAKGNRGGVIKKSDHGNISLSALLALLGILGYFLSGRRDIEQRNQAGNYSDSPPSHPISNDTEFSYHSFLSHCWAADEDGRDNHARVAMIKKALQERGIQAWFDDEQMQGNMYDKMANGIDNSATAIVFVTEKYATKVSGGGTKGSDDNCKLEFEYAKQQKGIDNMIVVVMESAAMPPWSGPLGLFLGSHLYYTFKEDDELETCVADLVSQIESRTSLL